MASLSIFASFFGAAKEYNEIGRLGDITSSVFFSLSLSL